MIAFLFQRLHFQFPLGFHFLPRTRQWNPQIGGHDGGRWNIGVLAVFYGSCFFGGKGEEIIFIDIWGLQKQDRIETERKQELTATWKRGLRARRPPNFMQQASKTSVSRDTSSKFYIRSFQNEHSRRPPLFTLWSCKINGFLRKPISAQLKTSMIFAKLPQKCCPCHDCWHCVRFAPRCACQEKTTRLTVTRLKKV